MQVVTVKTSTGQTRYYLANDDATPVEPVRQYLKFRDNGGAARNTLRLTCIFLKHYFTYLEQRRLRWQAVTIDDLADFLAWLKYPRMEEAEAARREQEKLAGKAKDAQKIFNAV